MILKVTRIIYKDYDEDDVKLSELRATTIKRKWIIDVDNVVAFGEHPLNKDFLLLWFEFGDEMIIQYDFDEFEKMFNETRFTINYEEEEKEEENEIPEELPKRQPIIEIPNISKNTNPDEG